MTYVSQRRHTAKPPIKSETVGWPSGYMSTGPDGVTPENALSDMTNADLSINNRPFIRDGLTPYGKQYVGTCVGTGTFHKILEDGTREFWEISAQVVSIDDTPSTRLYIRKDGEAWTEVTGDYELAVDVWHNFTQGAAELVFVNNGVTNMAYYDVDANTVTIATAVATPAAPTGTVSTALTGTDFHEYYIIAATNNIGTTDGSVELDVQVKLPRDSWDGDTMYVDLAFTLPTGATGGNIYASSSLGNERLIATVEAGATTYRDMGISTSVVLTPPLTNGTGAPVAKYAVNIGGVTYVWGDKDHPKRVWYDGGTQDTSGNFTISAGGGYVEMEGPTVPMSIVDFHSGKGDPAPTILCDTAAGVGVVRHLTLEPQTIGTLTANMPVMTDANGGAGCISPMGAVVVNNAIHFPTANGFVYEGNAPNIPNLLSSNSSSDFIRPDVMKLNLSAMDKARGIAHEGRACFSLPVISEENNQVWILDLRTNPARWVMPWPIPAKHMWHTQDNSGNTHFCVLVNGQQLEFNPNARSTDNGQPFRTRVAGSVLFDPSGMFVGYVQNERFRMLNCRGEITINVDGTTEMPAHESLVIDATLPVSKTGFGEFDWGVDDWGEDPDVEVSSQDFSDTKPLPMKAKLNGMQWEIVTNAAGCGYSLHSRNTQGVMIRNLYADS